MHIEKLTHYLGQMFDISLSPFCPASSSISWVFTLAGITYGP